MLPTDRRETLALIFSCEDKNTNCFHSANELLRESGA